MKTEPMIAAKVSRSEKAMVRAAAAANGESESALIRRLVLPEAARIMGQAAAEYATAGAS
jgi:uncharacterized protein (DUF1778 family)